MAFPVEVGHRRVNHLFDQSPQPNGAAESLACTSDAMRMRSGGTQKFMLAVAPKEKVQGFHRLLPNHTNCAPEVGHLQIAVSARISLIAVPNCSSSACRWQTHKRWEPNPPASPAFAAWGLCAPVPGPDQTGGGNTNIILGPRTRCCAGEQTVAPEAS